MAKEFCLVKTSSVQIHAHEHVIGKKNTNPNVFCIDASDLRMPVANYVGQTTEGDPQVVTVELPTIEEIAEQVIDLPYFKPYISQLKAVFKKRFVDHDESHPENAVFKIDGVESIKLNLPLFKFVKYESLFTKRDRYLDMHGNEIAYINTKQSA
jgi:hypothetical protein